jgi:hypothetical protein
MLHRWRRHKGILSGKNRKAFEGASIRFPPDQWIHIHFRLSYPPSKDQRAAAVPQVAAITVPVMAAGMAPVLA